MNAKWILESDFFWENNPDVISPVLDKHGIMYKKVKRIPFGAVDCEGLFHKTRPVISYGSLDFIKDIVRKGPWTPSAFCNLQNMKCSVYMSHYYDLLLNKNCVFVPIGIFARNTEWFCASVSGHFAEVFIRPDDGDKKFTGFVAMQEDAMETMRRMSYGVLEDHWMIVISSSKKEQLEAEYRFFVTKGEVISGCTYKNGDKHEEITHFPQGAYDVAMKVATNEWQPDPIYVVDVAKVYGEYKLLEINSFSSAGLYACDVEKVVLKANELAVNAWKEVYCDGEADFHD